MRPARGPGNRTTKSQELLRSLSLPRLDGIEIDQLLARWEWLERELQQLELQIREHVKYNGQAVQLRTVPGVGAFTALALGSGVLTTPSAQPHD